jgi:DNA-binding CsgD family transcriptional regulator
VPEKSLGVTVVVSTMPANPDKIGKCTRNYILEPTVFDRIVLFLPGRKSPPNNQNHVYFGIMNSELAALYQHYQQIIANLNLVLPPDADARTAHICQLFDQLDVVNTSFISIFDLHKRRHMYHSRKFGAFFGWDMAKIASHDTEYLNQFTHPDDFEHLTRAGVHFMAMGAETPHEKLRDFKLVTEYRLLTAPEKWTRVVEQQSVLEFDVNGTMWLALSVVDISPVQDPLEKPLIKLVNIRTGEIESFPKSEKSTLSKRERDVAGLVADGLASKEIADRLFLSVHTVNTHRQRIIEKLGVSNMTEAVVLARAKGLF